MKTLTLVRHAKSSWKDTSLTDRDRPLNNRGKIVCSPAIRAWTTAKIIANEIGYPREFLQRDSALYLASVNGILDVIVSQDAGFNNLMLVGHNPGFTDFANYLVPGLANNMPTASVVSVELDTNDWSLYDKPDATLLLYDFPKNRP